MKSCFSYQMISLLSNGAVGELHSPWLSWVDPVKGPSLFVSSHLYNILELFWNWMRLDKDVTGLQKILYCCPQVVHLRDVLELHGGGLSPSSWLNDTTWLHAGSLKETDKAQLSCVLPGPEEAGTWLKADTPCVMIGSWGWASMAWSSSVTGCWWAYTLRTNGQSY